jgi:hypothetical protein
MNCKNLATIFLVFLLSMIVIQPFKVVQVKGESNIKESPCKFSNFALDFDGLNDYLDVPHNPSLNVEKGITLESWIRRNDMKHGWTTILEKDRDIYDIKINPENEFVFILKFTTGTEVFTSHFSSWETNHWYHLAGTYDGKTVNLYLNGLLMESYQREGNVISTSDGPLRVGIVGGGFGEFFNGTIDEVRIWNYGRSQQEISNYMNTKLSGYEPGLIGYWNFDEETGQIVLDSTINRNNGLLGSTDQLDDNDPRRITSDLLLQNTQFNPIYTTVFVKNNAGEDVENAEVSAFNEEWGIVRPSKAFGERTTANGSATLKIFSGNWTFLASWKSGNNGLYVIRNMVLDANTSLIMKADSVINLTIYDFDSQPMENADILVIGADHAPMIRLSCCCTSDQEGSAKLEVVNNYTYDVVFLKSIESGKAFVLHAQDVRPNSNVTVEPTKEKLAHINFTITHRDGFFEGNGQIEITYPKVSLDSPITLRFDTKQFEVWLTPETVKFDVFDRTNDSVFNFFDEVKELQPNMTYNMFYGGMLTPIMCFYPEISPGDRVRQFWIQIADYSEHYVEYFYDSRVRKHYEAPIRILYPQNGNTFYEQNSTGLFTGELPFDPTGLSYQIHLDLDYFGVYDLVGNITDSDFLSINKIVTRHFVVEYPATFPQYSSVSLFAEQAYELMTSEMGYEADPKPPYADGKIRVVVPFFGTAGGWACGATMGVTYNSFLREGGNLNFPTWSFQSIFLHELSHIFRGTALPPDDWDGWFSEDFTEMTAVFLFAKMYGKNAGLWIRSIYSNAFFEHLLKEGNCCVSDRMMFALFYLHDRCGSTIHRDFNQIWSNETMSNPRKKLLKAGYDMNETTAILYSLLSGRNLAWLFAQAGIDVEPEKIAQGLSVIDIKETERAIIIDDREYHISTASNSLILYFDFTEYGVEFDVVGVPGIMGHCNVTIPRTLLDGHFSIIIDEIPTAYALSQNATHSSVYFVYNHSVHHVKVTATYVIPEFPTMQTILLLVLLTSLAVITRKRKHPSFPKR